MTSKVHKLAWSFTFSKKDLSLHQDSAFEVCKVELIEVFGKSQHLGHFCLEDWTVHKFMGFYAFWIHTRRKSNWYSQKTISFVEPDEKQAYILDWGDIYYTWRYNFFQIDSKKVPYFIFDSPSPYSDLQFITKIDLLLDMSKIFHEWSCFPLHEDLQFWKIYWLACRKFSVMHGKYDLNYVSKVDHLSDRDRSDKNLYENSQFIFWLRICKQLWFDFRRLNSKIRKSFYFWFLSHRAEKSELWTRKLFEECIWEHYTELWTRRVSAVFHGWLILQNFALDLVNLYI